jgi:hypothetical protein
MIMVEKSAFAVIASEAKRSRAATHRALYENARLSTGYAYDFRGSPQRFAPRNDAAA